MQKVVIPKGLVNPHETTIVEIPNNLRDVGTVVARPRPRSDSPGGGAKVVKKTYRRRSIPRTKVPGFGNIHDEGQSFGGRPTAPQYLEESYEAPDAQRRIRRPGEIPPPPPMPPTQYSGYHPWDLSQGELSYAADDSDKSGFAPRLEMCSSYRDIDENEGSLYRDFRPRQFSSRPGTPAGRSPQSVREYNTNDATPGNSYYKQTVKTSSPCETSEEVTEESVNFGNTGFFGSGSPGASGGGGGGSPCSPCNQTPSSFGSGIKGSLCPTPQGYGTPSSGGYVSSAYSPGSPYGADSAGSSYYPNSSADQSPCRNFKTPANRAQTPRNDSSLLDEMQGGASPYVPQQRDVMNSLGELEAVELHQIMGDLNKFQDARRRLIFDSSSLASASDVAYSFMSDESF